MRITEFANDEYYHIYNRGVDKREVFLDVKDYVRFLKSMREFNRIDPIGSLYEKSFRDKNGCNPTGSKSPIGLLEPAKIVDIVCYCLNPNHYHFILKQNVDKGIEKFMHKLGMGYTNYFNKKYSRFGSLFQDPFKSIHISTNEYLLYLSAYVNMNYEIHGYGKMKSWPYSCLPDYLGQRNGTLCDKSPILDQFESGEEYKKFAKDNAMYLKEKKEMERYALE
jgi:putative transposase